MSGIVLAGVLDYYAKVWGKVAEAELRKAMGIGDIFVGSWYPLENLEVILQKIWQETPARMRLAGQHTSKLIGDERRYDRKFYTPEQMLQETREAWRHSFSFGQPDVELTPGRTRITVSRAGFARPYWQEFLRGGITGMLSMSISIDSDIEIETSVDEGRDEFVYVFHAQKRER